MTTTLYRPVGEKEMELIVESGFRAFPPRLYWQPIFYPVLTAEYATRIASEWNTKDPASGFVGDVTRFSVDSAYLSRFNVQTAGSSKEREYWIPAADLDEFNRHIIGAIEVIARYEP